MAIEIVDLKSRRLHLRWQLPSLQVTENMLHCRPSYAQDSSRRSAASFPGVEGRIDHFVAKDSYGIRQTQTAYCALGGEFDRCGWLRGIAGHGGGPANSGEGKRRGENGSGGMTGHGHRVIRYRRYRQIEKSITSSRKTHRNVGQAGPLNQVGRSGHADLVWVRSPRIAPATARVVVESSGAG